MVGVLVTSGSAANLTALLTAREAAGGPSGDEIVYVSDQAHSSLARTARAMGLRPGQGFRALKVWVSVHTFGLAAFRTAIQRSLDLAGFAERLVRSRPGLTLMAPATLGIVCFRRE
jgi:glutamate/tyrosine decarboxylase-like PLP-dependent enzyme